MQVLRNQIIFDTLDAIQINLRVYIVIQSRTHIILIIHRVNYVVEEYLHFSGLYR
jgi:hypothetical protein